MNGFNYIDYLKRHFMLGQVDPWRKTLEDKPIFTLLVDLNTAIEECKLWSGQEISKQEFVNYLKINDIYLFKNIDEFKEVKERKQTATTSPKTKKSISPERKELLRKQMIEINNKKQEERKGSTA